jgi:hypothetical protein
MSKILTKSDLTKLQILIVEKDMWGYSQPENICASCGKRYDEHNKVPRLFISTMFYLTLLCDGHFVKLNERSELHNILRP